MKQNLYKCPISIQEESVEVGGTRRSDLDGDPRSKHLKTTDFKILWFAC